MDLWNRRTRLKFEIGLSVFQFGIVILALVRQIRNPHHDPFSLRVAVFVLVCFVGITWRTWKEGN